ncbi:uncharacterized protein LOC111132258 isoform X2 [Crassostrea virginica]
MSQRERTFFTQSSEFQNCRTCARYNQPAKMNPSSNRRFQDDETKFGQCGASPKRCIQRDWTNFNISNNFEYTPRRRQWRKPNTTKKRRREESVDDEEIKPSRKRPRLSPQFSHSWMWVRLPNGRKVLTLVSTDYLLYNCVSQVDFWSNSDAETILFGFPPNDPWGGFPTSSHNSVPITKEVMLPPKSVVSASKPHIVDQNNDTSLHDLKWCKNNMIDHNAPLPGNSPSTSFQPYRKRMPLY